mgnify:FL=1
MLQALKELLRSKKVMLALISIVVWAGGKFGLSLTEAELLPIVAPLWGALLGQLVADVGKSAAAITAGTQPKP